MTTANEHAAVCDCGWPLPRGLQLLTGGMDHVIIACGDCGRWWQIITSVNGGWSLASSERPMRSSS
jgi:hypothetical protein